LANHYHVRTASLADADTLIAHRVAMFADMGIEMETAASINKAFRAWLAESMPAGVYRAWVAEADARIVGGAGITVLPWPPGPLYLGDRLAFVYNVYTEPAHRHRGVAQLVMGAIHEWCRAEGIASLALNTSPDGRRLYEGLGYRESPSPMMFFAL
jgi:GNAT superfamily N-acetyltransferase